MDMGWVSDIGLGLTDIGVGVLVVVLILTGRIYPRSIVKELREDYSSRVTHWKEAYDAMARAQADQARLIEEFGVAVKMMQSLQQSSTDGGGESSDVEKTS